MRARLISLLLVLALALTACGPREDFPEPAQPVLFYYRTAQTDFSAEDGVIRAEVRDLGAETYTDEGLFSLYFQGPQDSGLISPISQDTKLVSVRRQGTTLELQLTRNANSPAEFDHTLTYVCLAKTGLALEGVSKVRIQVTARGGVLEDDVLLTESDILLFDSGAASDQAEITLYYTDESGDFLLAEKQTLPTLSREDTLLYVLNQLLEPPQSGGMRSALPPGATVLDVSVENGVCSVDFNGDFYANRPQEEQAELLTILSVVNTLCELEGIHQVQLYTQGRKMAPYFLLDLTDPWLPDSAPVGPVREERGEFAGTLCLPDQRDGLLHRMVVRSRARGGASREEALLLALFGRASQNGLQSPLAGAATPNSVSTENQFCRVDLAPGTLPEDPDARALAIRSIAATLCSLPNVQAVSLSEDGVPVTASPIVPAEDWYCRP